MNAATANTVAAAIIVTACTREQIDPRTEEVRATDYRVRGSLSTTQCWTWNGGDALVVVSERPDWRGDYPTFCVVRTGADVRVVEARGIAPAFRQLGIKADVRW